MTGNGYEFDLLDPSMTDYECPICLFLIKEAIELDSCGHTLCKVCLEKWIGENAQKVCPSCQAEYKEGKESKFIDRMITSTLKVKCKEHSFGCKWTGVIVDYDIHEAKCAFKSVKCIFDGCKTKVLEDKMHEHKKDCPFRFVQCEYCGLKEEFDKIQEHHVQCLNYPVICINEGCEKILQRKELPCHLDADCEFQTIVCDYHFVGCTSKFQRHFKENHDQELQHLHMKLILEHSKQTTLTLKAVQNELLETKEELRLTNEELIGTKQDLGEIQKELSDYKEKTKNTSKSIERCGQKIEQVQESLKTEIGEVNTAIIKSIEENKSMANEFFDTTLRLGALILRSFEPSVESLLQNIPQEKFERYFKDYGKDFDKDDVLGALQMEFTEIDDANTKCRKLNKKLYQPGSFLYSTVKLYPDRFRKILGMMETWKPYEVDDQVYMKLDISTHYFSISFVSEQRRQEFKNNKDYHTLLSSAYFYACRNDQTRVSRVLIDDSLQSKYKKAQILHYINDGDVYPYPLWLNYFLLSRKYPNLLEDIKGYTIDGKFALMELN